MSASFHHAGSQTSLDVSLGRLTNITPRTGQDHERYVSIGWGCDILDMNLSDAVELYRKLAEALTRKL